MPDINKLYTAEDAESKEYENVVYILIIQFKKTSPIHKHEESKIEKIECETNRKIPHTSSVSNINSQKNKLKFSKCNIDQAITAFPPINSSRKKSVDYYTPMILPFKSKIKSSITHSTINTPKLSFHHQYFIYYILQIF